MKGVFNMGTINYSSNNYVTVGFNYNYDYIDDFERETDEIYLFEELENIREKYDFYYFDVRLKNGYYEGFYIDIENNFPLCFDNYAEKMEAQKEVTQIKKFLLECLEYGACVCVPGWCTTFFDYADSKKAVIEGIKTMREEIKATRTDYNFNFGI